MSSYRYYDIDVETRIYTACCESLAVAANGQERRVPRAVVPGEPLTCLGCGARCEDNLVEEEEAFPADDW